MPVPLFDTDAEAVRRYVSFRPTAASLETVLETLAAAVRTNPFTLVAVADLLAARETVADDARLTVNSLATVATREADLLTETEAVRG